MVNVLSFVIAISFALNAIGQSQPPTPAPAERSSPPQEPASKADTRTASDQGVTIKTPVPVQLLNTGKSPEERAQEAKYEEEKATHERWAIGLNGLYVVFTLALAIFAGCTWGVARDTAKKELRAYVAIGTKGLYFNDARDPIEPGRPKMHITNFGRTPASNVVIWRNIVDESLPTEFPYFGDGFLAKNIMIHPGHTVPLFWASSRAEMNQKFVYGYIEYSDIYKRRWRFRFAYLHRGGNSFNHHETHNDEIEVTGQPTA